MKEAAQNKPFYWATIFLRELYRHGVEHLVISPGSRSTPLTVAAAAHPGFYRQVLLDERSAAYVALGMAKHSGKPAGLICTSGTAAANYYPAVVEARHSGVPIIVITADRPPNLRNVGASQAIDQLKIFGDYAVYFHEVGEPILERADLRRLKTAAAQAVSASITGGGAAHLNFPFRKPLEPDPEFVDQIRRENAQMVNEDQPPDLFVHSKRQQADPLPQEIRNLVATSRRPVVIEGPYGCAGDQDGAGNLSSAIGAPLLAEFPSGPITNSIAGFDGFLKNRSFRETLKPDLILRFGQQPVSKALNRYLEEHADQPQVHFARQHEWQDATHSLSYRVETAPEIREDITCATESDWLDQWKQIEHDYQGGMKEVLSETSRLGDGHVFNTVGRRIPLGWNLFLSNSFPLRDWMLFGGKEPRPTFVNRGASGIDGIISTAVGATIAADTPGLLFIGDLATLHDSNALLGTGHLTRPLVIIILNNRGGTIFRMLPIFRHKEIYEEYFETPQQVRFESLARAHSLTYRLITEVDQLAQFDPGRYTEPGIHVVECQTDPDTSMGMRHKLWNFPNIEA
ncbi:MAG: 2-succinyl-5-enolpyruvyl-6-hydroxy-3-cyclohexene-1-carboxylic-acid synthase [Balneolaceae bacterium]|nr:2-succinyl-5-enolpyruvyl-6-hydroxy-3-cyclohexene-1-carboxylic-acid synthase [Balneolaceae bacterium]